MIEILSTTAEKTLNEKANKPEYLFNNQPYFTEEFAIKKYQEMGYEAYYTENEFWWMIMSLLFWDVIFANIEDEFTPGLEQDMPHDFFKYEFYENREKIITNKFLELNNSDITQKIRNSYKNNYGKCCRSIVDWDKYNVEELINLISGFQKKVILAICERLLKNFNINRKGLPDLLVKNDKESYLSEIKSENDKLSNVQIQWHKYLMNKCNQKVELFLINHTEKKIQDILKLYKDPTKSIEISFGNSSSQKRGEAISFISKMPNFCEMGEGKDTKYQATLSTNDLDSLFKMLELTSGWKTLNIIIDNMPVKATDLKHSLTCYKEKVESGSGDEWCNIWYNEKSNIFGCKQISFPEFNLNEWNDFGYVDTEKGIWFFDKAKIHERLLKEMDRIQYCPLLNKDKILKLTEKFPESVNPEVDNNWSFLSNEDHWIYYNNKWICGYTVDPFPGYTMMTGVAKISNEEKNDIINKPQGEQVNSDKSGCFIATFTYGDYEALEVIKFRNIRDNYLKNKWWGKVFIKMYYKTSPRIVKLLNHIPSSKKPLRLFLNKILAKFDKLGSNYK